MLVPSVMIQHLIGPSIASTRHGACPTDILPLFFHRQPITGASPKIGRQLHAFLNVRYGWITFLVFRYSFSFLVTQPPAVLNRLKPRDAHDWSIRIGATIL